MEGVHSWGFRPDQPGVRKLLEADASAKDSRVEVEITEMPTLTALLLFRSPGDRVALSERDAERLIGKGFARRFAPPS